MNYPGKLHELMRGTAALALSCLCMAGATAADQVVSVKGKQVEAFAEPDNAQPGTMLPVANLPWPIKEEKNSFYRVSVGGKDAWVDAMQVVVGRDATDACPQAGQGGKLVRGPVAGSPGAGRERCK